MSISIKEQLGQNNNAEVRGVIKETGKQEHQFKNLGEYAEWRVRATLGLYPIDHPVSLYAQRTLKQIGYAANNKIPRITVYRGEPNAFVFPNGSIYLSDGLLQAVDNEEEVLFALMHEKIHYLNAHSEKVFRLAENQEPTFKNIIAHIGLDRVNEWEGDLQAFIELDKLGINPVGGIDLMEKFRESEGTGIDLVHGKSTDRALNLRTVTHLKDLKSIDNSLHPIPLDIKALISKEKANMENKSIYDQFVQSCEEMKYFKSTELIQKMDIDQALITLQTTINSYDKYIESAKEYDRYIPLAKFKGEMISHLSKRVFEELVNSPTIREQKFSTQQIIFLYHSLLNLTLGIDTGNYKELLLADDPNLKVKDPKTNEEIPWNTNSLSLSEQIRTAEDINDLLIIINPDVFEKLGLKLKSEPDNFIKNITQQIFDQFIFEEGEFEVDKFLEFATAFVSKLNCLYQKQGATGFNPQDAYAKIINLASATLDQQDKTTLLKKVEDTNPDFSDFKRRDKEAQEAEDAVGKLVEIFEKFAKKERGSQLENSGQIREKIILRKGQRGKEMPKKLEKKNTNFDVGGYAKEIRKIFQKKQLDTPQDLLTFLANFRKSLQKNENLWKIHEFVEDNWNELMKKVIAETPARKTCPNGQATLLDLKIALLLANNYGSSNLNEMLFKLEKTLGSEDLDLSLYRAFYVLTTDNRALAREVGVEVTTRELASEDIFWKNLLKLGKITILRKTFKSSSMTEFSKVLEILTNEFPFNHYGVDKYGDDEDEELDPYSISKRTLLDEIFKIRKFDLSKVQDLKDLYYLSTYLEDYTLAIKLQDIIWQKLGNLLPFKEGFAFLEKELAAKRVISLKAVSDFIEASAKTHEEIELASQKLTGMFAHDSSLGIVGNLALSEQIADQFFDDRQKLLLACVGNGEDDSYLKRYLYRKWVKLFEADSKKTLDNVNLNDLITRLYRLDAQSKYALLRELLTGDNGVFTDKDVLKRLEFINFFLDNHVKASSESEVKIFKAIKEVMQEVAKTANYDLLYFAISPLLQEKILTPVIKQIPWINIIKTEIPPTIYDYSQESSENGDGGDEDDYLNNQPANPKLDEPDYYDIDNSGGIWGNRNRPETQKESLPEPSANTNRLIVGANDADEIFRYINGDSKEQGTKRIQNKLRNSYEDAINELIGKIEAKQEKPKMTVNEFLLEIAQKLGAPGVRFLQLVGQYVELPPNFENTFNQVYDRVGGQSKITADQTLLREWPQARDDLTGLHERLGGGSLMSVFKARTKDGRDLAIKILNPNAEHHTATTHELLSKVFATLAGRNVNFAPSVGLLEDIREWIKEDINFTGFIKIDQKFREKHNGYSTGGRYKIKIPLSYPPENKYFIQEEYIEGTNLTDVEKLKEQGHDLKAITSLVVKNFLEQIKDGTVHSDLHPGNIRITSDNQVAYLDRNFYLHLSIGDRLFFRNLAKSLGNTSKATSICIDYVKSQGVEIDRDLRNSIMAKSVSLEEIVDPASRLMHLSILLRKEGLKFPIKTTLLMKDMFYLDRLAKRAGYSGIEEASQSK